MNNGNSVGYSSAPYGNNIEGGYQIFDSGANNPHFWDNGNNVFRWISSNNNNAPLNNNSTSLLNVIKNTWIISTNGSWNIAPRGYRIKTVIVRIS
jgi:hypothetical protein